MTVDVAAEIDRGVDVGNRGVETGAQPSKRNPITSEVNRDFMFAQNTINVVYFYSVPSCRE